MASRYLSDYVAPGLLRTFAVAFDATGQLGVAVSVDRNAAIAHDATCEVTLAGSVDRNCLLGFDASVALTAALTVIKRLKQRRRGILVDGACR